MRNQYSLVTLFFVTAIVGLWLTQSLSFVFFTVLVEAAVLFAVMELLYQYAPKRLFDRSHENCWRTDGSWSERRAQKERQSHRKVRTDLLAVLLLVALSGNWLFSLLHSELIPLPVAWQAASAFSPDPQIWKQRLREQRVDTAFEQWSQSKAPVDRDRISSREVALWNSWPLIVAAGLFWVIGSWIFLSRAYSRILREFRAGIDARAEKNVDRDITRLQSEAIVHQALIKR